MSTMERGRQIFAELRTITTFDLAYKASNILEKILWALIAIIGTISFWAKLPLLSVIFYGGSFNYGFLYHSFRFCCTSDSEKI